MKRYIKSSVTDLELDRTSIREIEKGLYDIVSKYFNSTFVRTIRISESRYDILPYTARPDGGSNSELSMEADSNKLNEFKSSVRKYLKQFGVTRVKFDIRKYKLHYGYISGPDDFPMNQLLAIYFG